MNTIITRVPGITPSNRPQPPHGGSVQHYRTRVLNPGYIVVPRSN